jgi:hypothetical protein
VLSGLSQRARVILIGVVGTVAAFFVFGGGRDRTPPDPYTAVPRDSFLVLTLNLAELRRSPLYDVLLGKDGPRSGHPVLDRRSLGIGDLTGACGFDPLARVETLALAVPEEGDKGELGVVTRVSVTRDELTRCATALAARRGGRIDTKEVGGFTVVENSKTSEGAARPRLAYGHGGLLVVGRGAWFDAILATADGKRPGLDASKVHAAMRGSLTSKPGWQRPTLLLTVLIPRALRARVEGETAAEVAAAKEPWSEERAKTMAGVLGVSAAGLALKAGESGQSVEAMAELVCDTDEACASVEKLVAKTRFDWSRELSLRMLGLGPLLDSIDIRRDGAKLRVTAGTSADGLVAVIDRVMRLQARRRDQSSPAPPAPPRPDETIPAPRTSSSR